MRNRYERNNNKTPAVLPPWKKEIRSKEEIGNCKLKPKNCKNFLVKDDVSP